MTPERIGNYPIEREIGRGGMGIVYLGRDTRLDRRVAIKVLTEAFANDPDRLARFEREARVVASLNHRNIAGIYGIEEAHGVRFLSLEFIDGETLADRLKRGPLLLDEALDVCRQVSEALETAHESGIVHRDLKPANIKITPSGDVKVLDFGLAKSDGSATGSVSASDLTHSPTLTNMATGAGVILGTAAYMSPEQARGKAVDKRADIWAFGCLLYECLTGQQAFAGETVSDMIARILQGEPDWSALPARTPERVRGLLRRCLEKDVRRRLRDIGDARMEIEDVLAVKASSSAIASAAVAEKTDSKRFSTWGAFAAVALIAGLAGSMLPRLLSHPASPKLIRFKVEQPDGSLLVSDGSNPQLSPDGTLLGFVAFDSSNDAHAWIRPLNSTEAKMVPGTEGAEYPFFWSPDSRQIAFGSHEKLKKVSLSGGEAATICPIKSLRGGSWSQEGVILLAPFSNGAIYRVSAGGGEPVQVTTLDSTRKETAHRWPQFLPDGKHFLFSALPPHDGKFDTFVGSLDSKKATLLMSAQTGVTWAPPGHLIFSTNGTLMSQRFDPGSLKLVGEPVSLGDLNTPTNRSGSGIASAANGAIVIGSMGLVDVWMAWTDYSGRVIGRIPVAPAPYSTGMLSPDDRRAVLTRFDSGYESSIWIADLERGVATRFTDDPGTSETPDWSPDGSRIAWVWSNHGPQCFKVRAVAGGPVTVLLDKDPLFKSLDDWTPDSKSLIYERLDPTTQRDLWIIPADGNGDPHPLLNSRFSETNAHVSPDGRWIAYDSDESGQVEAYVQSFPIPGGKYQVTNGGGGNLDWTADGKRLVLKINSDPLHGYMADVLPGAEFRLGPTRLAITVSKDQQGVMPAYTSARLVTLFPVGSLPQPSFTVLVNAIPGATKN